MHELYNTWSAERQFVDDIDYCRTFIVSKRDDMVFSGLEPEDVDGGMMTLLNERARK